MGESCEKHMFQGIHLRHEGGVDGGMPVAKKIDPPGTDRIDVAVAIKILEPYARGPSNGNGGPRLVILHLRAGVPENVKISFCPFGVARHFLFTLPSAGRKPQIFPDAENGLGLIQGIEVKPWGSLIQKSSAKI